MSEVVFKVEMTCSGCSGAVARILRKIEGVNDIDANLDTQEVKVQCSEGVDPDALLVALQKWATASNKCVEMI